LNKTTGTIVTRSSEPKPKRNLFPYARPLKARKGALLSSHLLFLYTMQPGMNSLKPFAA